MPVNPRHKALLKYVNRMAINGNVPKPYPIQVLDEWLDEEIKRQDLGLLIWIIKHPPDTLEIRSLIRLLEFFYIYFFLPNAGIFYQKNENPNADFLFKLAAYTASRLKIIFPPNRRKHQRARI